MLAVTSLISPPHAARINRIIKSLEKKFGLDDVQATPDPHITYLMAGGRKQESLRHVLEYLAHDTQPFDAFTTGLGVFPGTQPVIYIPVLRSDALNRLQGRLLDATAPLCLRTARFSHPNCWLPHISLALHDTSPDLLGPVLRYLNGQTYNLRLHIDNFAILRQQDGQFVPEEIFKFGKA